MDVQRKEFENNATIKIHKEWANCIDTFGLARAKQWADSYRENAKEVILGGISFYKWCAELAKEDPTYTGPRLIKSSIAKMRKKFPKGTIVKVINGDHLEGIPVGAVVEVRWLDDIGMIHVVHEGCKKVISCNEKELEIIEKSA